MASLKDGMKIASGTGTNSYLGSADLIVRGNGSLLNFVKDTTAQSSLPDRIIGASINSNNIPTLKYYNPDNLIIGKVKVYTTTNNSIFNILLGSINNSDNTAAFYKASGTYGLNFNPNTETLTTKVLSALTLKSTVVTGTAPLTVSSTTVVSNLNADLLDGTHKSGLFTSLTNDTTNNTLSLTIGGVTKSTTVNFASKSYELNLQWGGNTKTGSLSPLGTAMSNLHSANRLAFSNVNGMTVEISHNYTNASPTWSTHSCTNDMKINVISGIQTGVDIKLTNSSNLQNPLNTSDALRITLAAKVMGIYIHAKKLLLNISSGCNFYVKIEKASSTSNEQALTGTSWETLGSHLIAGWSGWNEISLNTTFGGYPGLIQTSFIRLTFYFTTLNPTSSSNAFRLINMCLFGDNYYLTPSSLAETGHIYKYDANQNAIFPNSIQAKTIVAKDYIQINDPSFLLFTHPNGIKSTVKLGSDGVLRFYTDATFKNTCNIEANILRGYKVITDKESCFGYNGSYTDPAPGYEGSIKAAGPIYCGNLIQASAFYENSDIRLKKDVSHIMLDNLNKAKNIEFKQFKFNNSKVLKYGVIAQEIENIGLDSLVKDEYTKSVDYISLLCLKIALLELEIKELKNDIVR